MHDEMLHTDFYDLRRVFRGDWQTTVLGWLRDGARRPRDLEAMAENWRFYDRWRQTQRGLALSHVRHALVGLAELGLVERQRDRGHGFEHHVVYQLTPAGEAFLVELDRLRAWLRRHPGVLDDAVRIYHERRAS